jgi:hypothetical protein
MPVRYLSDPEMARLSSWPDDIADQDAVTYFTLSGDDLSWLAGFNRPENRLGVAVQLSSLPWLGWIPTDLATCPTVALDRLARSLTIAPRDAAGLLAAYGGWQGETRRKHRAQVLDRLGWRWCGAGERKLTRLAWLRRGATAATPEVLKAELAKLEFLCRHGAQTTTHPKKLPLSISAQVIAHRFGVPGIEVQQQLHAIRGQVPRLLGDRPGVLSFRSREQSQHIHPGPATGLHLRVPARDQREHVFKPRPPPLQTIISHRWRRGHRVVIQAHHTRS